jgi:hypothetical protein
VCFYELNIKFYIKSKPKLLKIVKVKKSQYDSYPTEFVLVVKNEELDQFFQ